MTHSNTRYDGLPTVRQAYMTEFLVECPKCLRAATVTTSSPYFFCDGQLNCDNCQHSEKAADLIRYRVSVKRYCDNCGTQFEKVIPTTIRKVNELTISCPQCGITRTFKARNDEVRISYGNTGLGNDPIFHLPLWLQHTVKAQLLWAYNRHHLQDIKQYISAKLRERQARTHTTMVERLPNFIKASKNRNALLKAIEKMEQK
ncbi:hypothetical protein MTX78_12515 [Hymenobacter tibetensis]|uniref:Replication restart DNA helicase PriA n=1 Tax=Hymenobacter tibetensis TaxID=497967 RepID=A0ABY4CRQ6_9BACT|nr:hypothetical protein [Hymenobacter tibetensis]UOG72951.1 hypothetical protein MTX78_12515 [Hymenobacter tibetensis]